MGTANELLSEESENRESEVLSYVSEVSRSNEADEIRCQGANQQSNRASTSSGGGCGWFLGSLLIVNAALGAGLLNFPASYHHAGGVVAGTMVQLVLMAFIIPALLVLAYSSDLKKSETLQEVLRHICGKNADRLCSLCVAVYSFGTCITFLIIIGDQFDKFLASVYGPTFCKQWYLNRNYTTTLSSLIIILPFCYAKKIDFLRHISSLGVISVLYVNALIVLQFYSGKYVPGEIRTRPVDWVDIFFVVPTICFGYQCHVSIIPVYSCFRKRNLFQFSLASSLAIVICAIAYTLAAIYGYMTFGSNVQSDILLSYDAKDPWILVAIIAIAIKTYSTYPILSFCGNAAVQDLVFDMRNALGHSNLPSRSINKIRYVLVSIWFSTSLLVAILVPDIGVVIEFLGSLAACFIFIFPGACLLRLDKHLNCSVQTKNWLFFFGAVFVTVGSFIFGCVATQALISKKHKLPPICVP